MKVLKGQIVDEIKKRTVWTLSQGTTNIPEVHIDNLESSGNILRDIPKNRI